MKLEVRFMGIFLLVRPRSGAEPVARILIPNAIDPTVHEDGDPAVKHYPFLVRDDNAASCAVPKKPQTLLDLHRTEVVFRFDDEKDAGTIVPADGHWDAYRARPLIGMRTRIGAALKLRSMASPIEAAETRLGSLLHLVGGKFETCPPDGSAVEYRLKGRMTPLEPVITEGIHLTWTVEDVDSVSIDYRSLKDPTWRSMPVAANGADTIGLTVGNLCADNPRRWHECGEQPCENGEAVDDDFKWMYRLFEIEGGWPTDRRHYFSVPTGLCAPDKTRGATTSTCWGGDCGEFC
jgi:hypothetical protein